jgi:hypothetical protein
MWTLKGSNVGSPGQRPGYKGPVDHSPLFEILLL